MATLRLTQDFREFLNLLNSTGVEYLLIGGYAVGLYGYVRPTKNIDVWVATNPDNLDRLRQALQAFGFRPETLPTPLFEPPRTLLRMGLPPNRLEVLSEITGVAFADCYVRRRVVDVDGVPVPLIDLDDLTTNKLATGRARDAADVEQLTKLPPDPHPTQP